MAARGRLGVAGPTHMHSLKDYVGPDALIGPPYRKIIIYLTSSKSLLQCGGHLS